MKRSPSGHLYDLRTSLLGLVPSNHPLCRSRCRERDLYPLRDHNPWMPGLAEGEGYATGTKLPSHVNSRCGIQFVDLSTRGGGRLRSPVAS
jgi:hypothetical protein